MKIFKKIFIVLPILISLMLFVQFSYADPPCQRVKVIGRQLMVNFACGPSYQPYFIKGVDYSPYPVGTFPSEWGTCEYVPGAQCGEPGNLGPICCGENAQVPVTYVYNRESILQRDFTNMTPNTRFIPNMNANTIRTWSKATPLLLEYANNNGVKVIAGFWIDFGKGTECRNNQPFYELPAILDPTNENYEPKRNAIRNELWQYVAELKDHPGLLFWALGNENNLTVPAEYHDRMYSFLNELAGLIKSQENAHGLYNHPVAIVNGDIGNLGQTNVNDDGRMTNLDIWGANVYRGKSFNNAQSHLFPDYASRSTKPLWISEYGVDAYYTYIDWWKPVDSEEMSSDAMDGYEDQATQANWTGKLWDEVIGNRNITIGASVMAYKDEWWPPGWVAGSIPATIAEITSHDLGGYGPVDWSCPKDGIIDWDPPAQDHYFNEEYWGIMKVNELDQNSLIQRDVYTTFQKRFACPLNALFYATPDNSKSCDGTSACCGLASHKAERGRCVVKCAKGGIKVVNNAAAPGTVKTKQK